MYVYIYMHTDLYGIWMVIRYHLQAGSSALTLGLVLIWDAPPVKLFSSCLQHTECKGHFAKTAYAAVKWWTRVIPFQCIFRCKTLDPHVCQYLKYWNSCKSEISPPWSHLMHQENRNSKPLKCLKSQAGFRDRVLKKVSFVGSHHFVHINVLHHKSEGYTCLRALNGQKKAWSHQEQHVAGKAQQDIVDGEGNAPEGLFGNIRPPLGVFAGFPVGSNAMLNEQRQHRFPWTLQDQMDHQKEGTRQRCRYVYWWFVVWYIYTCKYVVLVCVYTHMY